MAKPRKIVRNGRVFYLARWYDPDGNRVSKSFSREKAARDWQAKVDGSKVAGEYIDPRRGKITAGGMADLWLTTQGHLKPSTLERYRGIVEKYVRPRWGDVPLSKLSHADIAAWISGIKLSAASVRYIHRVLFLVLELAVRDGRLSRNPAAGVRLPKVTTAEKRYLTRDEVFRLADAAAEYPIPEVGGQYRALVLLLAFCGLRWGEAAGLKVGRLDLLRRRVTVAETLSEVGGHLVWSTPKNHQTRSVPLPGFLADLLAEVVAGKAPSELVFTTMRGRPLRNLNFRRDVFDRAAADVGLAGFTPKGLRDAAASLGVSAGANVKAVQRMLGHASAAMTLDVYAGLFDDDLDAVAERLNLATASDGQQMGNRPNRAEVVELRRER
jgi:integrase